MVEKVDLVREPVGEWWPSHRPKPIPVRRMLPFVWRGPGRLVHRARSASLHHDGRLSVQAWCGPMVQKPSVLAKVPDGAEVCATCEGRAAGAGQIPSGFDEPIKFTPRAARPKCEWERRTQGYGYCDYGPCGVRGVAHATLGDRTLPVCTRHRGSAILRGWDVVDIGNGWR